MIKIENFYRTMTKDLHSTFTFNGTSFGFKIPDYQRRFDWSEEEILRLYINCLSGFSSLSTNSSVNKFTYLGTLILLKDNEFEKNFEGNSWSIIDGQQRLSSLALFACALIDKLVHMKENGITESTQYNDWINKEIDRALNGLSDCIRGVQENFSSGSHIFPKIIRESDNRSSTDEESSYESPIALFLFEFYRNYFVEKMYEFPEIKGDTDWKKFKSNFVEIKKLLTELNNLESYEEYECDIVQFNKSTLPNIWELFHYFENSIDEKDEWKSFFSKETKYHGYLRILAFSLYFLKNIALTSVETESEDAAFEIFDALNTTGLPLTGLETLKPKISTFLKRKIPGTIKNKIKKNVLNINKNIDNKFQSTNKKNIATKQYIVAFALYYEGKKISQKLSEQRNYLRYKFEEQENVENVEKFIADLSNLSEFLYYYWHNDNLREISKFHTKNLSEIQLLMSVIKDMKTKMALPILFRFWNTKTEKKLNSKENQNFLDVLRALTAFITMRRSVTGSTAGIEVVLRNVMSKNGLKLCVKECNDSNLPKLSDFKKYLWNQLLNDKKYEIKDKTRWCDQVSRIQFYNGSRKLAKFLLMAAAHNSVSKRDKFGGWKKVRNDPSNNVYLSFDLWESDNYKTLEHIAPSTAPDVGWESEIYDDLTTIHRIGNLCLLPGDLNTVIGNADWETKKTFYELLTDKDGDELEDAFDEVEQMGLTLKERHKKSIRDCKLSILTPIKFVKDWNCEVISNRGKNIAECAWIEISPWIKPNN